MTQGQIWAEVSCEIPASMVDRVSDFLVELSGGGVSVENLTVDTFAVETVPDSEVKCLKAYFPADSGLAGKVAEIAAFLSEIAKFFPEYTFQPPEVAYIREEDWANNWKEHFKPSRIGKNLIIKPTWEQYDKGDRETVIEIDPGMAFGTGTHSTTKLCLETLERIFSGDLHLTGGRGRSPLVLDVGTGSGVLAIAAAKLGAARVTAIDIDPGAVAVAKENVHQNRVGDLVSVGSDPLENIEGTYDVIVANILAEELVRLAPELNSRLKPGGVLVLSGILSEKEELVIAGFSPYRLTLLEITRDAEWSCLAFGR